MVGLVYMAKATIKIVFSAIVCLFFWNFISHVQRKIDFDFFPLEFICRMKGPLSPFDENLIKMVREKYLVPPSQKTYNLEFLKEGNAAKQYTFQSKNLEWRNMKKDIRNLFPSEQHGFFIETGAFDGEFMSHSLYLEMERGWKGLLIEPMKEAFFSLQQKNRKAWSCNCCLSTKPYPHETVISKITSGGRDGIVPDTRKFYSSILESRSNGERNIYGFSVYETVQCFPLETLLLAINQTHVDLVILDIEDVEVEFLKHFAWDKINVDVWIVEHRNPEFGFQKNDKDPRFIKWFNSKGYVFYKMTPFKLDYIFIKKNSTYLANNHQRLGI